MKSCQLSVVSFELQVPGGRQAENAAFKIGQHETTDN
jgi:hypothetical protein